MNKWKRFVDGELWKELRDDILLPRLEELRFILEQPSDFRKERDVPDSSDMLRGRIAEIRFFVALVEELGTEDIDE